MQGAFPRSPFRFDSTASAGGSFSTAFRNSLRSKGFARHRSAPAFRNAFSAQEPLMPMTRMPGNCAFANLQSLKPSILGISASVMIASYRWFNCRLTASRPSGSGRPSRGSCRRSCRIWTRCCFPRLPLRRRGDCRRRDHRFCACPGACPGFRRSRFRRGSILRICPWPSRSERRPIKTRSSWRWRPGARRCCLFPPGRLEGPRTPLDAMSTYRMSF